MSPDQHQDQNEMNELRQEVARLRRMVDGIAQTTAVEHVISHGLAELSEQLAPLRELAPKYEQLREDQAQRLNTLRAALARPRWRGSDFEVNRDDQQCVRRTP